MSLLLNKLNNSASALKYESLHCVCENSSALGILRSGVRI